MKNVKKFNLKVIAQTRLNEKKYCLRQRFGLFDCGKRGIINMIPRGGGVNPLDAQTLRYRVIFFHLKLA